MNDTPTGPEGERKPGDLSRPGFLLLIITLFGAALRLYKLGAASLWYDEAVSLYLGRLYNGEFHFFDPGWNNEAPLNAFVTKIWHDFLQVVSDAPVISQESDFLIRLLPCLLGILSIPVLYKVARRLLDRQDAAMIATLLFALSPFQVYYAQELRVYAMFVFIALVATWYLSLALEENKHRYWVAMVLALALMTYAHFISVWIILAFNMYFLVELPAKRHLFWRWTGYMLALMALIAPALLMAHWMNELVSKIDLNWYPKPTPKTALVTFKNFFAGYGFTPWAYHSLFAAAGVFTLLGSLVLLVKRPKTAVLLVLLLVVPIGANILMWSIRHFSFYEHRLFIFSGVAAILLAAYGIASLRLAPLVCTAVIGFGVLSAPCLRDLYAHRLHPIDAHRLGVFDKVDFRSAAAHIESQWHDGDLIVHDSIFTTYSMRHYIPTAQPHLDCSGNDGALYIQAMANESALRRHEIYPVPAAEATAAAQRIWLIEANGITFDNFPQSISARQWLEAHGFVLLERTPFFGVDALLFGRIPADPAPAVAPGGEPEAVSRGKRPNVVVILVDTLRADHLGLYGYGRPTSPFLDSLAPEALVFDEALSPSSYTRESVAALFTGAYPSHNAWGMGWYATPDPSMTSLAECFQSGGYRTALFSLTPMIRDERFYEGFDLAECLVNDLGDKGYSASGQGPRLVERMKQFLGEPQDKPFFAYLHFLDPHGEYEPPMEFLQRFAPAPHPQPVQLYNQVRFEVEALKAEGFGPGEARFEDMIARYDGEIAFVDQSIREIFEQLREHQALDDTVVVITADHGEEFLEHGYVEHAWQLYHESIHVPLILWAPGMLPAGRVKETASLVDVMPTLLALQGLDVPAQTMDGVSLVQAAAEGWTPAARTAPVYSELLIQTRALLHTAYADGHSYIAAPKWFELPALIEAARQHKSLVQQYDEGRIERVDVWGPTVHEELYACPQDPGQRQNLAASSPEALKSAQDTLSKLRAGAVAPADEASRRDAVDETTREQMNAIGYLNDKAGTP